MNDKIELFADKRDCCACGACLNICPKKAISFKEDENGFTYPTINRDLCVGCHACQNICGFKHSHMLNYPIKTYAAAAVDRNLLKRSASGGAFAVIAKKVIEEGGIVYGVAFNNEENELALRHICISKVDDLQKLQGSKYVQSDVGYSYKEIKQFADAGRKVLFSGTPCQVDALRRYLGKDYDNVILIDIICHGVPGRKLFNDYMSYRAKKLNGKITDFYFRDKTKGQGYTTKTVLKRDDHIITKIAVGERDAYIRFFSKSLTLRENCYECPFAGKERVGDITLGDYWGFHKENPDVNISGLNDKLGVSCVLCNTDKGLKIIDECRDDFVLIESEYEKIARNNKQLNGATDKPAIRESVLEAYRTGGYEALEEFYSRRFKKDKIKYLISGVIPRPVKVFLKKL